jgi:hypothetical protein
MSGVAKFIDITTGLTTDKNGYGVGTLFAWMQRETYGSISSMFITAEHPRVTLLYSIGTDAKLTGRKRNKGEGGENRLSSRFRMG